MDIAHLLLGGCLAPPPLDLGLTPDTGGHLVYALGAAMAMARRYPASRVTLYGRAFEDDRLGLRYARKHESIYRNCRIVRLATRRTDYLDKEELAAELDSYADALIAEIARADRRPDALHAHFADAGVVALRVRERFGIPVVYNAHSLAKEKAETCAADDAGLALRLAQEEEVIAGADAVVASSHDEADRQLAAYRGYDRRRVHVLPPGAELTDEGEGDAEALLRPFLSRTDRPLLLAVARPVERKNLPWLVELYGRSPALRARADLAILAGQREAIDAGDTAARRVWGGIVEAVDRHDLYGHVAYPKRHTAAEVQALYRHAARTGGLFLNPAGSEPFGLTIIEAAAAGLPVVATSRGGPPDILAALRHGRLADPRDPAAFEAAMRALLENRGVWEAASRNGRERVGHYSWDRYAESFARMVRGLAPASRPAPAPRALVVCDMDGTLTGDRDAAARFARWREARPDVTFALATGRRGEAALDILDHWGLPRPDILIGSVGTEIDWGQGSGYAREGDFLRGDAPGWCAGTVEAVLAGLPDLVPQPRTEQRDHKRSYLLSDRARLPEIRHRLAQAGQRVELILSHDILLDILPVGGGKARAVAHVARRLGVAPERVVAAGDSANDADMLLRAHHAVAVGNYHPELAATGALRGAYAARAHHAAGVLEGLDRLGLGERGAR